MEKIDKTLTKYKAIIEKSFAKKDYNATFSAINFLSVLLYEYNQEYKDDFLEDYTIKLANVLKEEVNLYTYKKSKSILFYDGFSIKSRGLAPMYLTGLIKDGYDVIYIVKKENIDYVDYLKSNYGNAIKVVDINYVKKGHLYFAKELTKTIYKYQPQAAFFYTTPFDSEACAAFGVFEGLLDRYLIDLTDHAYWLGVKSNDYFIGSRNMSASNLLYHRGVKKEQFIKNEVNLIITNKTCEDPLPFDIEKESYVFSGGALYKTFGDEKDRYYTAIRHILENHPNVYFLYAGYGDTSKLDKIIKDYPDRAFFLNERPDFYNLIAKSTIYLNTYPIGGGLMMKYAAQAMVLPVTLRCDEDIDELLLNQEKTRIIYDSYDEFIKDIDRLLDDEAYRKQREKLLEGSTVSEERFDKNLRSLIEDKKTDFDTDFSEIDTTSFIKRYKERFVYKESLRKALSFGTIPLFKYTPGLIIPFLGKMIASVFKK